MFTDAKGAIAGAATAARGGVVSLYLTGAGAVSPAIRHGRGTGGRNTRRRSCPRRCRRALFRSAEWLPSIEFAGIPTALVGVTQINLRIPATAPLGTQPVIVTIGGVASVPAT